MGNACCGGSRAERLARHRRGSRLSEELSNRDSGDTSSMASSRSGRVTPSPFLEAASQNTRRRERLQKRLAKYQQASEFEVFGMGMDASLHMNASTHVVFVVKVDEKSPMDDEEGDDPSSQSRSATSENSPRGVAETATEGDGINHQDGSHQEGTASAKPEKPFYQQHGFFSSSSDDEEYQLPQRVQEGPTDTTATATSGAAEMSANSAMQAQTTDADAAAGDVQTTVTTTVAIPSPEAAGLQQQQQRPQRQSRVSVAFPSSAPVPSPAAAGITAWSPTSPLADHPNVPSQNGTDAGTGETNDSTGGSRGSRGGDMELAGFAEGSSSASPTARNSPENSFSKGGTRVLYLPMGAQDDRFEKMKARKLKQARSKSKEGAKPFLIEADPPQGDAASIGHASTAATSSGELAS